MASLLLRRMRLRDYISALMLVAMAAAPAVAEKWALLPFADLSVGPNAVNIPFTREFGQEMQRQGFDLVPQEAVYGFMAENRLRVSGYLDAFDAMKMGRDLGCSHVLVGTVTEHREGKDPAFGLVATLLDVATGVPVWSAVRATSLSEHVRMLGLGQPRTLDAIRQPLVSRVVADMPREFAGAPEALAPDYRVSDFMVHPRFLRASSPVHCRLNMDFLNRKPERICVEYASGEARCLEAGEDDGRYRGSFPAPEEEGAYDLTLVLYWGESRPPERLEGLAAFEVINRPPRLALAFNEGVAIDDITVFRSHLIISPELKEKSRVERWALEIRDQEGNRILSEEYEGLLPERLVWEGRDKKKRKLKDGVYLLNLSVWDPAGNLGQVTRKVAVQTSVEGLNIATIVGQDGTNYLHIEREGDNPTPIVSWSLKAESRRGEPLARERGENLPAKIPLGGEGEELLFVSFEAVDRLGNTFSLDRREIHLRSASMESTEESSFASFGWETGIEDL